MSLHWDCSVIDDAVELLESMWANADQSDVRLMMKEIDRYVDETLDCWLEHDSPDAGSSRQLSVAWVARMMVRFYFTAAVIEAKSKSHSQWMEDEVAGIIDSLRRENLKTARWDEAAEYLAMLIETMDDESLHSWQPEDDDDLGIEDPF